jgi:protein PET117
MSRASKLTLAATGLGTAGIVYFVHWAQENDRAVCTRTVFLYGDILTVYSVIQAMHRGVERDMEKQRIRQERQAEFEMQKRLEQEYLKLQTVHSTTDGTDTAGQSTGAGS